MFQLINTCNYGGKLYNYGPQFKVGTKKLIKFRNLLQNCLHREEGVVWGGGSSGFRKLEYVYMPVYETPPAGPFNGNIVKLLHRTTTSQTNNCSCGTF